MVIQIYTIKKIKMFVISDTHNCLNEEDLKNFIEQHKEYDVCLLLVEHSTNDISIILKYVDNNKIYGLLGNHDYNYLKEFNINNLNGKIININGQQFQEYKEVLNINHLISHLLLKEKV